MDKLEWKVNTQQLLAEVLSNDKMVIFHRPFQIFISILGEVTKRCAVINDPVLNGLMARLALYSQTDPYSPDFDKELTDELILKYKEYVQSNRVVK